MFRTFSCVFLFLVLAGCVDSFGQEHPAPQDAASAANSTYDAVSFASELQRIGKVLEAKPSVAELTQLRDTLPRVWVVSNSYGKYEISSEPLRDQLLLSDGEKALLWVNHLQEEVQASTVSGKSSPQAHAELQQILARREFGAIRPPSAWDLFRERLAAWIQRQLMKLFGGMAGYPIAGKFVFYTVLIAAVVFIAMWVFRFFASREQRTALPVSQSTIAGRTWQDWIRSAREAASRADYREAVHSAYWAGIVRLEDAGSVPSDRTKTPREYLLSVTAPVRGELAPVPAYCEALTGLTSRLERVWYANRGAGPEDYRESLRQLEALGCPLE
jgi:hypothetical protein